MKPMQRVSRYKPTPATAGRSWKCQAPPPVHVAPPRGGTRRHVTSPGFASALRWYVYPFPGSTTYIGSATRSARGPPTSHTPPRLLGAGKDEFFQRARSHAQPRPALVAALQQGDPVEVPGCLTLPSQRRAAAGRSGGGGPPSRAPRPYESDFPTRTRSRPACAIHCPRGARFCRSRLPSAGSKPLAVTAQMAARLAEAAGGN